MHKHVLYDAEIYTVQTAIWKTGLQVFTKNTAVFDCPVICAHAQRNKHLVIMTLTMKIINSPEQRVEYLDQKAQSGLSLRRRDFFLFFFFGRKRDLCQVK